MTRLSAAIVLICLPSVFGQQLGGSNHLDAQRNRMVVLTDIGADPDDAMSLLRLLTYSNSIDIEGLVATTSEFQEAQVHPEMIERVLDAYGQAQPNLSKHEGGYPTYATPKTKVSRGLPIYGMGGVGKDRDSPGSQ